MDLLAIVLFGAGTQKQQGLLHYYSSVAAMQNFFPSLFWNSPIATQSKSKGLDLAHTE